MSPRGALGFVSLGGGPPTQPGTLSGQGTPRLPQSRGRALVPRPVLQTACSPPRDHWRSLWHQERAEGAQLAEGASPRSNDCHTRRLFSNSSPGFKRHCYELTRIKDSADEARASDPLGLFSNCFLTHFSPSGTGSHLHPTRGRLSIW